jgi:hypothetical protein
MNVIPRPPPQVASKEVAELQTAVKQKQMEVDALAETNRLLNEKIKETTKEMNKNSRQAKKEQEEHLQLQSKAKILITGLKNYEEKISELQSKIDENEKEMAALPVNSVPIKPDEILATLTDLVSKKFEEVEKNLKESIFTEVNKNNKNIEDKLEKVSETNKTYADALAKTDDQTAPTTAPATPQDFRSLIREEHNEQRVEETDKRARACNIVIHGLTEMVTADDLAAGNYDDHLIDTLLADIGLEDLSYRSVARLGKKNTAIEQSKRPIKVTMIDEQSKDRIMANLKNLKGKDNYKGVSITDDHTVKERNTIREWVEKAKAANALEPTECEHEWKVRGCPKNGMRLMKFRKRNSVA